MGDVAALVMQSQAIRQQGKYEQFKANMNARFAERQAVEVEKQGKEDAYQYGEKVKGIVGSQRAAFAAAGIDISDQDSSIGQLTAETEKFGRLDQITIKQNAWEQAWGIRTDAQMGVFEGNLARQTSRTQANQTLAVAGLKAGEYAASAAMGAPRGGGGGGPRFQSRQAVSTTSYNSNQISRTA